MNVKDKPNKVSATLKVIVTGEFYDDESTEETLRFTVEQDLEDAGYDVDVYLLKEQEAKTPVECEHNGYWYYTCPTCGNHEELFREWNYCPFCGQAVKWE